MENRSESESEKSRMEAVRHVSEARSLLNQLRSELDRHPGLEEAITRLEMALNVLSAKSSGLL